MSWVKAISDSITQKTPMRETLGLIQGGISAVTVQVPRAIDATDPADYPLLLLAVLEMSAKSFRQSLPPDARFLSDLIEQLTASVAVAVPADFRQKEGGHEHA